MAELQLPAGTVRAISFDLDFTLWDLSEVIPNAERKVVDYFAVHCPELLQRHDVLSLRALRERVAEQRPELRYDITALRKESLRQALVEVGRDDPELVDAAFEVFLEERHRVHMFPETRHVLEALRGRVALGAVTNGNADVARIGLGEYFDFRVSAMEVGAAKPDRIVFETACSRAGHAPHAVMHVGDEPESDVIGAARYGMIAVWLNREGAPWPEGVEPVPHVQIRTLEALVGLVGP